MPPASCQTLNHFGYPGIVSESETRWLTPAEQEAWLAEHGWDAAADQVAQVLGI